jgi:membrane associated rhomboid family serine protease
MIVIPTGTDAPIYHWPRATVALIVLNVAAFLAVPPRPSVSHLDENDELVEVSVSNFERYALALGDGLHPTQWLTHNFLHYGFLHLAGNMLFLWCFGIVVEGKMGALKYLATYLAIGTLHGALVQSLLLHSGQEGHAAGASAVIFGLLAVCMIWAPRNELNCAVILIVGFRILVYQWDLYYTTVALWYIGEQVFWLALRGFAGAAFVSELGHLSGALWGTVLAVGLLKAGWVDCEGWDLFALAAKRRQLAKDWKRRGAELARKDESIKKSVRAAARRQPETSPEERAAAAVRRVRKLIDAGDIDGALSAYDQAARSLVGWPAQTDLYALIKAMHAQQAELDSLRMMRDHCRYYPADSAKVRLKLAQVLIRDCQRPAAALRSLAAIPPGSLPPDLEKGRQQLTRLAIRMQRDGVLEVEGDD